MVDKADKIPDILIFILISSNIYILNIYYVFYIALDTWKASVKKITTNKNVLKPLNVFRKSWLLRSNKVNISDTVLSKECGSFDHIELASSSQEIYVSIGGKDDPDKWKTIHQ